ncbi:MULTISPECIES: hypothetical protein [unclassified Sphingobium]|uniref:hypothetical protein n=1 Tax=unclassified Sphingobium TaxID=2611147 RepID=UPI0035A694D6
MSWKSTTFKKSPQNGRFVVKGSKASASDPATNADAPAGAKGNAWAVAKDGGSTTAKGLGEVKRATAQAVAKYQGAMSGVVLEAKKIAEERRETLDSIKDPELKRSAAR